jgi:hypothetical protein
MVDGSSRWEAKIHHNNMADGAVTYEENIVDAIDTKNSKIKQ